MLELPYKDEEYFDINDEDEMSAREIIELPNEIVKQRIEKANSFSYGLTAVQNTNNNKSSVKFTREQLRDLIVSEIKTINKEETCEIENIDKVEEIDEASTTAAVAGYILPLGASNHSNEVTKPEGWEEVDVSNIRDISINKSFSSSILSKGKIRRESNMNNKNVIKLSGEVLEKVIKEGFLDKIGSSNLASFFRNPTTKDGKKVEKLKARIVYRIKNFNEKFAQMRTDFDADMTIMLGQIGNTDKDIQDAIEKTKKVFDEIGATMDNLANELSNAEPNKGKFSLEDLIKLLPPEIADSIRAMNKDEQEKELGDDVKDVLDGKKGPKSAAKEAAAEVPQNVNKNKKKKKK